MLFVGGVCDGQTVPTEFIGRDRINMWPLRELIIDVNKLPGSVEPFEFEPLEIVTYVRQVVWLTEDPGMSHTIYCPDGWSLAEVIEAIAAALRRGVRPGGREVCRRGGELRSMRSAFTRATGKP